MKKILSLILVLILMMSVAVVASAADGTGTSVTLPDAGSLPSLNDAFMAISDFLKLEAFAPYISGFHEALGDFYIQLDLWLRALGVVINGVLGGVFAG